MSALHDSLQLLAILTVLLLVLLLLSYYIEIDAYTRMAVWLGVVVSLIGVAFAYCTYSPVANGLELDEITAQTQWEEDTSKLGLSPDAIKKIQDNAVIAALFKDSDGTARDLQRIINQNLRSVISALRGLKYSDQDIYQMLKYYRLYRREVI